MVIGEEGQHSHRYRTDLFAVQCQHNLEELPDSGRLGKFTVCGAGRTAGG